MSFEVDHLFESGGAEYGEYIRLIENAERGNLVQTFEDRKRLGEPRTLLSSYAQWLSQVRECLNNYKKTEPSEVSPPQVPNTILTLY